MLVVAAPAAMAVAQVKLKVEATICTVGTAVSSEGSVVWRARALGRRTVSNPVHVSRKEAGKAPSCVPASGCIDTEQADG